MKYLMFLILVCSISAHAGSCEEALNNLVNSVLIAQRTSDETASMPDNAVSHEKWNNVGIQKNIAENICKQEGFGKR